MLNEENERLNAMGMGSGGGGGRRRSGGGDPYGDSVGRGSPVGKSGSGDGSGSGKKRDSMRGGRRVEI